MGKKRAEVTCVAHTVVGDVVELAVHGCARVTGLGPGGGRWIRRYDRGNGRADTRGPYYVAPDEPVLAVYLRGGETPEVRGAADFDPVRGGGTP